jgi:subtilase family serine protease
VTGVVDHKRGTPDISMSAAVNGGAWVYYSFQPTTVGWHIFGGTSEASPIFSGVVALADQYAHHRLGLINPALYLMSAARLPGIADVTSGNNTVSFSQGGHADTVPGYSAQPGYDLASGVGTVNAARFVPELALFAGH